MWYIHIVKVMKIISKFAILFFFENKIFSKILDSGAINNSGIACVFNLKYLILVENNQVTSILSMKRLETNFSRDCWNSTSMPVCYSPSKFKIVVKTRAHTQGISHWSLRLIKFKSKRNIARVISIVARLFPPGEPSGRRMILL